MNYRETLARRESQRNIKHYKAFEKISFISDAFLLAFMTLCSFIGVIYLLRVMSGG